MNPRVGAIFRLAGPLVEIVCLVLLRQVGGLGRTVSGVPVESLLYAGLAAGFVLWGVGFASSMTTRRRPRDPG